MFLLHFNPLLPSEVVSPPFPSTFYICSGCDVWTKNLIITDPADTVTPLLAREIR